jgi:ABC-type transport system substrate-binding protein
LTPRDRRRRIATFAGWKKGADGVRLRNGVRMEWELRTNAGNKVRETLITVLADQSKQIGASVTTKPVQFPQLVTQLSQTREFDMILLGIAEGLDPDHLPSSFAEMETLLASPPKPGFDGRDRRCHDPGGSRPPPAWRPVKRAGRYRIGEQEQTGLRVRQV